MTVPYQHLIEKPFVRVVRGEHCGRAGTIVSFPWLGNLWHLRLTINVEGKSRGWWGGFEREWITVWRWQVESAKGVAA